MREYMTEESLAKQAGGKDEQTVRKWAWIFIDAIALLETKVVSSFSHYVAQFRQSTLTIFQIVWNNRFQEDVHNDALTSVDGVDCKVPKFKPFWPGWYSYKSNGPGLRYEVALCIRTGCIVWINGPFLPGRYNDLQIFQHALKHHLTTGEFVEADGIYRAERTCVKTREGWVGLNRTTNDNVGSRHETVNKCLKVWQCLAQTTRHSVEQHSTMFRAVAVITELRIENGEPLFSVDYDDTA